MSLLLEEIYLPCYDTPTFTFPLLATTTMLPFVTDTAVFAPLPTTVRPVPTVPKLSVPLPFVFKNCPAVPSEKASSVTPTAPAGELLSGVGLRARP